MTLSQAAGDAALIRFADGHHRQRGHRAGLGRAADVSGYDIPLILDPAIQPVSATFLIA
jgi:hypothetical protein